MGDERDPNTKQENWQNDQDIGDKAPANEPDRSDEIQDTVRREII